MKRPLYETPAEAAPVTCKGTAVVVLLPEAPEEAATPGTPVVGFAEPAVVAWLATPVAIREADWDTPAAEDAATGTIDTVSTDAGADEASTEETGTGTIGEAFLAGEVAAVEPASETGQTVVYNAIVEVRTMVELAGQLVTVAAQDVTVMSVVL